MFIHSTFQSSFSQQHNWSDCYSSPIWVGIFNTIQTAKSWTMTWRTSVWI